jgi:Zn-dependent oligopeptidase
MGKRIVILLSLARPTQDREILELQEFAMSRGFHGSIQLWDLPYWRRKQYTSLFRYGNFLKYNMNSLAVIKSAHQTVLTEYSRRFRHCLLLREHDD